jgi:FtsP/CotA-like multicopper oxidase with cupredoxin domain
MEVLPRKYRFRILNADMSRFIQLQIADPNGNAVQFLQIANDGNLFVNPISLTSLDQQGTAERYDIIVDFSKFKVGDRLTLVNTLQQTSGRKPDGQLSLQNALAGSSNDPGVGGILQFRIVSQVQSVDVPGVTLHATDADRSVVPNVLTEQIPIITPVRERVVQWGRSGNGDSRGSNGQCIPDCPDSASFPWSLIVNGGQAHSMNANRIQLQYPKAGGRRALDLHQRRRRLGSPDPSAFRGRHHHEPRERYHPRDGTESAKGRLAVASLGSGAIPDPVRGIWRILRQPLPQHGA